jgi:hypothetical protein
MYLNQSVYITVALTADLCQCQLFLFIQQCAFFTFYSFSFILA